MFPDEELNELKDRISQMPDRELLRIVEVEYDDYRKEALDFAKTELQKRGVPFEEHEVVADENEDADSPDTAPSNLPCRDCGGVMRSGLLFADKELTMLFDDDNDERFIRAFGCVSCGSVKLSLDLETEVEG